MASDGEMQQSLQALLSGWGPDGLFFYEADLPFHVFSNVAVEVLFCGATLFVDNERVVDHYYAHGLNLGERARQIVTLPDDHLKAAEIVSAYYPSTMLNFAAADLAAYENYMSSNEKAILDCIVPFPHQG